MNSAGAKFPMSLIWLFPCNFLYIYIYINNKEEKKKKFGWQLQVDLCVCHQIILVWHVAEMIQHLREAVFTQKYHHRL